jgi:hypothetical protein
VEEDGIQEAGDGTLAVGAGDMDAVEVLLRIPYCLEELEGRIKPKFDSRLLNAEKKVESSLVRQLPHPEISGTCPLPFLSAFTSMWGGVLRIAGFCFSSAGLSMSPKNSKMPTSVFFISGRGTTLSTIP